MWDFSVLKCSCFGVLLNFFLSQQFLCFSQTVFASLTYWCMFFGCSGRVVPRGETSNASQSPRRQHKHNSPAQWAVCHSLQSFCWRRRGVNQHQWTSRYAISRKQKLMSCWFGKRSSHNDVAQVLSEEVPNINPEKVSVLNLQRESKKIPLKTTNRLNKCWEKVNPPQVVFPYLLH